jgi:hypothetical protein
MVATLCDGGKTIGISNASMDDPCPVKVFEGVPKANPPPIMGVPPWHATPSKLHDLLTTTTNHGFFY